MSELSGPPGVTIGLPVVLQQEDAMCLSSPGGCGGCAELVSFSGRSLAASPLHMVVDTTSCVLAVLRALCNAVSWVDYIWSLCVGMEVRMVDSSMVMACVSTCRALLFG